jgi:O-antigen/teichoic acid export membrane protein
MVLTEKLYWFIPSLQNAIFPIFSSLHTTAQERLGPVFTRALRYQAVLAVSCGLGISVLGPWAIQLLFPSKFWLAGALVTILGWVCVPRLIGSFFITVLQSSGKERQVSWIAAAQCGVYLCTIALFIQLWGLEGFAWAYLFAETTAITLQASVLITAGMLTRRHILSAFMTLGSGLAVFCLIIFLPHGRESFLGVLGLLMCYPLLLLATRGISSDDVRYLQGLWTNEKPLTA